MSFTVVLDANVLYPFMLRDVLIRLGQREMYSAKWTDKIQQEWVSALLENRPDLNSIDLERTVELMNSSLPDCVVEGYQKLIPALELPDPDDRHVLAAAIKAGADLIVTYNLKDFPEAVLDRWELEAVHPDEFLTYQLDLNAPVVFDALRDMLAAYVKHPVTELDLLTNMEKQGLVKTAARLKAGGFGQTSLEFKIAKFEGRVIH